MRLREVDCGDAGLHINEFFCRKEVFVVGVNELVESVETATGMAGLYTGE